jgi:adenine/guanine phosphoribosyltransferase-like PRPP-binding protein
MRSVLIAWELGGNWGHISQHLPVARALRARGARVAFAVSDPSAAAAAQGAEGYVFLQAPAVQVAQSALQQPSNFADILAARGFSEQESLHHSVQGWSEVFRQARADAILVDHAPGALFAARMRGIPALQLAMNLGVPYREGFVKNRYIGRTFIMPGQAVRRRSVRQKLNVIAMEFKGKNVLLVDDSIVRGTTSREIVQMARESGARKVFFATAAPPVRFPNVYGIDMPTRAELIAAHRSEDEVAAEIGADALIYQDLEALKDAVRRVNPRLASFEASCFDGQYVTGDVTSDYLQAIETRRDAARDSGEDTEGAQLDLNLVATP